VGEREGVPMKKLPYTPNSQIRSALRNLTLRSRERSAAIKRDKYTCQVCGRKQSKAKGKEFKVEVHHKAGIPNWAAIFEAIRKYLLIHPDEQITLCKKCHEEMEET